MRIYGIQRAEIAIEKLTHHLPEPRFILGKSRRQHTIPLRIKFPRKETHLRSFTAAVNAFDGDQLSPSGHEIVLCSIASVTGDDERGKARQGNVGKIDRGARSAIVPSRRGATGLENADRRAADRRTARP